MKYIIFAILSTVFLISKGVKAGSVIENIATIEYSLDNKKYLLQSSLDKFVVDRIVDIKSSWQDSSAVEISAGEKNRVLTFLVANEGNSDENVSVLGLYAGSEFAQENIRVFVDSNNNGIFDNNDTQVKDLLIKADDSVDVFIVSDTPKSIDGNFSKESLFVEDKAKDSKGKVDNKEKIDTVVRSNKSSSVGVYRVRDYHLVAKKSAKVIGGDGLLHTGSIVEYSIEVKIEGEKGEFNNVFIKDNIPTNTTYISNSLKLDGIALSDKNDSDKGFFDKDLIAVSLGKVSNINNINKTHKISFQVQVK